MKKRIFALISASALATAGFMGVSTMVGAQPAQAATCYYSNLTSSSVKNVDCAWGAYGVKSSASSTSATRIGSWVSAGRYSYNPNYVCYAYPTMVRG